MLSLWGSRPDSPFAFIFAAAVFARLAVDADVVVPIGVHEAVVAVAQRTGLQGCLAGARRLQHARAPFKSRRAVVVAVAVAVRVAAVQRARSASAVLIFLVSSPSRNFEVLGIRSGFLQRIFHRHVFLSHFKGAHRCSEQGD